MPLYTLTMHSTPPSLNAFGSGDRRRYHRMKKALQEDLGNLLMYEKVPRGLRVVTASAVLRFPTRRGRDEGNYRFLIEKALGDALEKGGWLPNDTPEHYTFGRVHFDPATGPAKTTIFMEAL